VVVAQEKGAQPAPSAIALGGLNAHALALEKVVEKRFRRAEDGSWSRRPSGYSRVQSFL
jgi:hypothetical protein